MRLYLAAILIVLTGLWGCDDAVYKANQQLHSGSLAAVESCISFNKSELVDELVIRARCVEKHERSLARTKLDGRARVHYDDLFARVISADISNLTSSYIVTRVSLKVVIEGKGTFAKVFDGLWIQPEYSERVFFEPSDLGGTRGEDIIEGKWTWNFIEGRGIKISVD